MDASVTTLLCVVVKIYAWVNDCSYMLYNYLCASRYSIVIHYTSIPIEVTYPAGLLGQDLRFNFSLTHYGTHVPETYMLIVKPSCFKLLYMTKTVKTFVCTQLLDSIKLIIEIIIIWCV